MKVVCIVQARVGSTRLPGKVLKNICGKTVLEHCINRLKRVKYINEIIVATTTLDKDDAIVKECKILGVKCFRGSEEDVLSRYYYAAKENYADAVVRITSDCPLVDSVVTENIIKYYIENAEDYDYVSNTIDRTYPRGLDTEVFSFNALEKSFKEAKSERDREHVTPYIWDNKDIFNIYQYKNNNDNSELRWTLDTEEDFKVISFIFENFKSNSYFGMKEIINLLKKNPEIIEINKCIEQKKLNDKLFLIPANELHCDLVFEWANDEEVRKHSFNNKKIIYEEHRKWYLNKLKDVDCNIFLLADSYKNIGIVRCQREENDTVISYSISKENRGKGYGYKILAMLEEELVKKYGNQNLIAYVKKENLASIRVFERLNYVIIENNDERVKFEKIIK